MTESRQHFRAAIQDNQIAVLSVGPERVSVKVLDQSTGGLSLFAKRTPDFFCEAAAEVKFEDGFCIAGRIKHIDQCEEGCRIGFQRAEMIDDSTYDLRNAFPVREQQTTSGFVVAVVLVVGLGLGWLWQSGTALQVYARAASTLRSR